MKHVLVAALAVTLVGCTQDFEHRPPDVDSHVATYFLPQYRRPKLDLLFVIDDTTAMGPWQDRLAEVPALAEAALAALPGGLPDLRIAVTTNGGALRTSNLVADPYIVDAQHFDGSHTVNYSSTLHDALASLVSVGATGSGPTRVLSATRRVLERGVSARRRVPRGRDDHRNRRCVDRVGRGLCGRGQSEPS